jgi:AMP-binding enzyme
MPKPIVHGHGGFILENLKAASMHFDVGEGDRFLWFASTIWIMWNLWVATLASGCTILQLDANPGYPEAGALFGFAARERAAFLGTSPAYLSSCIKAGISPGSDHDLSAVRTLGSTGSPLPPETYRWAYRHVKEDILLAAISGGTDPGAAFLTSCPILPVHAGEMQCRGLGVALHALDDSGKELMDEVGELVVTEPMPSMPLYFWGDEDGKRYHESYFETYPGLWRHGDWLRLIPRPSPSPASSTAGRIRRSTVKASAWEPARSTGSSRSSLSPRFTRDRPRILWAAVVPRAVRGSAGRGGGSTQPALAALRGDPRETLASIRARRRLRYPGGAAHALREEDGGAGEKDSPRAAARSGGQP